MTDLHVEINKDFAEAETRIQFAPGAALSITPPLDEDYWIMRVKLSADQAIVAFPKHGQIGIGFAQEEDWNTNLPSRSDAEQIFDHIKHNKGDELIPDEECIKAIRLLQETIVSFLQYPKPGRYP